MVRTAALLAALTAVLACTNAPWTAAPDDEPFPEGEFTAPEDFPRESCEGGVDSADLPGVWHLDIRWESGPGSAAVRFDAVEGGGRELTATVWGYPVPLRLDGEDLLAVLDFTWPGGIQRWAFDLCTAVDGETLAGHVAFAETVCDDLGSCSERRLVAPATAHRIDPLRGGPLRMELVGELDGTLFRPWSHADKTIDVRYRAELALVTRRDALYLVDTHIDGAPYELSRIPRALDREVLNDADFAVGPPLDEQPDVERLYALLASDVRGVVVYDITDVERPREVATLPLSEGVHTLFVEHGRVYVAGTESVIVYEIEDPRAPRLMDFYTAPDVGFGAYVHDLYVEDHIAYLAYWSRGLVVVDLTDPTEPVLLGDMTDYEEYPTSHSVWVTEVDGRKIAVHGDEGFGAHVRIVDVDPASDRFMEVLGSWQTREPVSVHNVQAHGATAYVTYYHDGVHLLDLSDPAQPEQIARFPTWVGPEDPSTGASLYEGAIGIDVDTGTGRIYAADTHRGLLVLEHAP